MPHSSSCRLEVLRALFCIKGVSGSSAPVRYKQAVAFRFKFTQYLCHSHPRVGSLSSWPLPLRITPSPTSNSLPDFSDALPIFDSLDGDHLANGAMKDLFRRHNVQGIIGLALTHKHFDLCEGERVTDIRGTSNPLTFELGEASTWRFSPERRQLVPLEFSTTQSKIDWQTPSMQAFLDEFSEIVVSEKADGILGLCSYPGDGYPGRVEVTVGRSNVNLTPEEVSYRTSPPVRPER